MKINEPFNSMTLKQKLLQMFISGFEGTALDTSNARLQELIKEGLGGVIFFGKNIGSYEQTRELTGKLQSLASTPLYMSIDQEGAKVCRTKDLPQYIHYWDAENLSRSGKVENAKIQTRVMSKELGFLGFNMNFSPVMDVNSNPQNPVIGVRSFGPTPDVVFTFAQAVYKTFQGNNIAPVGKHFPGHGDTSADSHDELPVVALPIGELEKIHVKPFVLAFKNGLDAVMIAHVHYPAFNPEGKVPASLSREVITGYLRGKFGFKGLVISDDMVMKGVANGRTCEDMFAQAINAGIDVMIYKNSDELTPELLVKLEAAVRDGKVSEENISASVKRILEHKARYGILENHHRVPEEKFDIVASQRIINQMEGVI